MPQPDRAPIRPTTDPRIAVVHDDDLLVHCEAVLDYRFQDLNHLQEALTHASGANHRLASNERLEFLGDAILGAIVCEKLYRDYPEFQEGDLTRIKSVVVSRKTCAKISRSLGFHEFLILGKGMGSHDTTPDSILADVFESLVGAIYLDGGIEAARRFILTHLGPEIEQTVAGTTGVNYKSTLQQAAQRVLAATPSYLLLDEKGPDHSKCFKIAATIAGKTYASAWGPNKKDAEQRAARNALAQLNDEAPPFESD